MEENQEDEDYFAQNAQSYLIIDDVHMKKIQSERIPNNDYFIQNASDAI